MVYQNCFCEHKILFPFQCFWRFAPLEGVESMILIPFYSCDTAIPTRTFFNASPKPASRRSRVEQLSKNVKFQKEKRKSSGNPFFLNLGQSNAPEIPRLTPTRNHHIRRPLPSEMPQDIRQVMPEKATPGLPSQQGEHGSLQHPNVPVNRFCWFWLMREAGE
jgi:hypothetical protein